MKIAAEYERASRLKRTRAHTREAIERLNAELTGESYSGVSLREFTAQWLESKSPETAPSTGAFYVKTLSKLIAALGSSADHPMADIGKADLLRFRNDLAASGLAPKTVNQTLKVGRMLFKAAKRDGIISENPLEFVANVRARLATNRGTFSLEQLRAILAVADPEWRSLVLFGFYTGQRLGDLARLRWNNVDLVSGRLTLVTAKTGKRLSIPWPVPLRKHIEGLPRGTDANAPLHPRSCRIVESQQGRTGTLSRQFGELLMKSGVREKVSHTDIRGVSRSGPRTVHALSFHSLRRTATTLLHEAGVPQAIAQAFIGHDSPAMHEIYVAVGGEALEKAAAAFPDLL